MAKGAHSAVNSGPVGDERVPSTKPKSPCIVLGTAIEKEEKAEEAKRVQRRGSGGAAVTSQNAKGAEACCCCGRWADAQQVRGRWVAAYSATLSS